MLTRLLVITLLVVGVWGARAQDTADLERMVRDGMAEALDARLAGGRTPDEQRLIALAYANKARRATDSFQRTRAWEQADERFARWVGELERRARAGVLADRVRLAAGRVEYAGTILSGRIALELDEYEISLGRRGDRKLLAAQLNKAREQYERAGSDAPVPGQLSRGEEEDLLAAGLYDTLRVTRLDLTLNGGWASYYLGVLIAGDERSANYLSQAERAFQELVNSGQAGTMQALCQLGLAMAQRELGRADEALRNFAAALDAAPDPVTEARVRYELARAQIKAGKFDEARATLRPLVYKDPQGLSAAEQPARFYVNLAHLWSAYSYLLEADAIQRAATDSVSQKPAYQKALRCRETGLANLNRLARQGGPWPALVQLYVARTINLKRPLTELSTMELIFSASTQLDSRDFDDAARRLNAALARDDLEPEARGEALFELGRCEYERGDERAAATAFDRLATEQRAHTRASQAVTLAYQLWGRRAERTQQAEDYLRLAATLRNLIENYADHPERARAAWLLPVTLQLAGRYAEAAEQFAKVPAGDAHWEEAQYRHGVCLQQALEALRAELAPAAYRPRAQDVANGLLAYAAAALARGRQPGGDAVLGWSAQARLLAAELLLDPAVGGYEQALKVVEGFETQYPDSDLTGRALAVRMRALCARREFRAAAQIVSRFLEAAPAEHVGGTLAVLAHGMQTEVERLLEAGERAAAQGLAADSVAAFEELQKWVEADAGRAAYLDAVQSGRARMLYLAGRYDDAEQLVDQLLQRHPRSGNFQQLRALVLTARLPDDANADALQRVQAAWALLLADPTIRRAAPERYWEARYHWLGIAQRLGQSAAVEQAIFEEWVWGHDLGGSPWKERLERLYAQARTAQDKPPMTPAEAAAATDKP